jgi:hypothetical protein
MKKTDKMENSKKCNCKSSSPSYGTHVKKWLDFWRTRIAWRFSHMLKILITNWRTHHKFAPSIYSCFCNILTMCSKWSANKVLIQSLISCNDGIVTHYDD